MIVADTGPIIAFARIGRLALLHHILGEVVIPEAVYNELIGKGQGKPGAQEVKRAAWIRRQAITDRTALAQLPPHLHLGEQEAIILAQELRAQFLIDERRGRSIATEQGLEVLGSLRILAEAKRLGLIDQAKPLVEAMLAEGYWIEEELIQSFLQECGEAEG